MSIAQQTARSDPDRYQVTPRTLIFVVSGHEVLLIRGAPTKRLWPNRYNGIGGHVERGESVYAAARRELAEETGIHHLDELTLRGVITIDTAPDAPGILLFVFRGSTTHREVAASPEGTLHWVDWHTLPPDQLLEDLPQLLPRVLGRARPDLFYAHYSFDPQGHLHVTFEAEDPSL
jgi:8-oxo-dGTP diphosphatase